MTGSSSAGGGSARDALAHRDFRIVFIGSFLSNIGRWMQQVVLGAFAWELTESATFVGLVVVAQLGPMLVLSLVGGALADSLDRRRLLIATQAWQAGWAFVLAALVVDGEIDEGLLLGIVALTGVAQAIFAPTWGAVLPTLAGRENMTAAISLNSTSMNGSRVIGPAIGGVLWAAAGPAVVFLVNGLTYAFVIAALLRITIPAPATPPRGSGPSRIVEGLRFARTHPPIRRTLVTMTTFVFFCLPFIGQMPTLAELNLGIDAESGAYGLLYACFGLGAVGGALSVGTVLRPIPPHRLAKLTLVAFGVLLAVLAVLRAPVPAYPVVFAVGFCYFATSTSMNTHLQHHIDDDMRGRVMALWVMSYGGTVPLGQLVAGPLVDATSITAVVLGGAVVAVLLGLTVSLGADDTPDAGTVRSGAGAPAAPEEDHE